MRCRGCGRLLRFTRVSTVIVRSLQALSFAAFVVYGYATSWSHEYSYEVALLCLFWVVVDVIHGLTSRLVVTS